MKILTEQFKGRLGRKNWFLGLLITQIFFIVAIGIIFMLSNFLANFADASAGESVIRWLGGLIILFLAGIDIFLILSLHTRRLHDLGKSAHWLLLLLIPFVNVVFLIYLLIRKGQSNPNKYGEELFGKKGVLLSIINRS